jgi:hypothetical protein
MNKFMKLSLAAAVVAVGLLASSCIVVVDNTSSAQVRFTWESRQRNSIVAIYASKDDVIKWRNNYYKPSDATVKPNYSGSSDIPSNLFPNTTNYNGRYFTIAQGNYTAVCTIEDQFGYIDIVANYEIAVVGEYKYFEVAFNVWDILNGADYKDAWDYDIYNSAYTTPMLSKSKVKPYVITSENGSVTYYVFRRPANI